MALSSTDEDREFQARVTGAPRGIVYTVEGPPPGGQVAFHGYDAARNVLLYAKRFDGFPRGPSAEEVLSEARLQVRAFRNDTPIEWHVATKDKADLIEALLQTDLELREITVVYPPRFLAPT
jgi:hypothetical protein